MPITVIKGPDGVRTLFTTTEAITQSKVLRVSEVDKKVAIMTSGNELKVAGVAAGGAFSGQLIRSKIEGVASGLICAEAISYGQTVQGGERISGTLSGIGGLIRPLTSGVGAMLGRALNSGDLGSGIPIIVDLG